MSSVGRCAAGREGGPGQASDHLVRVCPAASRNEGLLSLSVSSSVTQ